MVDGPGGVRSAALTMPAPASLAAEARQPYQRIEEPYRARRPDALLRFMATNCPRSAALASSPPQARSFTWEEADTSADALAKLFSSLGLAPGERIAMQLANMALEPVVALGAWRAGLTLLALPLFWRRYEIAAAIAEFKPRALIGSGAFDGVSIAHTLRDVAASELSVRFVFGFRADLPDGVGPLDRLLDLKRQAVPAVEAHDLAGPALVTFTARPGTPLLPVLHAEDELMAKGERTVFTLGLDRGDTILNPFPLSSPLGSCYALLPWLLSGARLIQHAPFAPDAFAQTLLDEGVTVAALPAPLAASVAAHGALSDPICKLRSLCLVWSPGAAANAAPLGPPRLRVFDIVPDGDGGLSQPVPRAGRSVAPTPPTDADLFHRGSVAIDALDLDRLYRAFPGFLDAAAFMLPCPIMGARIQVAAIPKPAQPVSLDALHTYLARLGVSPSKYPERLVLVKSIPRDAQGRVVRAELAGSDG